jgi:bacteriocin resistance YdeI/OmpD-like protein/uncharacterized protein DUF1905
MLTFQGLLEAGRGGGSFVELPSEVAEELGPGRQRVRGALNGVAFASSTMPMGGGRICVGIHKAVREAARTEPGARVVVEIERDDAPRELDVPGDLADALSKDQAAREAFDALSFTNRKEYAQWVAEAKKQETRDRRLARAIEMLRDGVRHP